MVNHTNSSDQISSNTPMQRTQWGFTLIEITLVLVLLGILSSVAVPKYFDLQDSARAKACLHHQSVIAESLQIQVAINHLDGTISTDANQKNELYATEILQVLKGLDSGCAELSTGKQGNSMTYACPKLCESEGTYTVTQDDHDGVVVVKVECSEHHATENTTETALFMLEDSFSAVRLAFR